MVRVPRPRLPWLAGLCAKSLCGARAEAAVWLKMRGRSHTMPKRVRGPDAMCTAQPFSALIRLRNLQLQVSHSSWTNSHTVRVQIGSAHCTVLRAAQIGGTPLIGVGVVLGAWRGARTRNAPRAQCLLACLETANWQRQADGAVGRQSHDSSDRYYYALSRSRAVYSRSEFAGNQYCRCHWFVTQEKS